MFTFLKRLVGTSEEYKIAEARYKKQLGELAKRELELEALGKQLHDVSELQKEKNEELNKTSSDLANTINRSINPGDMKVAKEDEREDEDRNSGEIVPAYS